MTDSNNPSPQSAQRELVITRLFNAPRSLVFKAWTDPKHVAQWWGPSGYTNPVCELDVRPGGAIYIEMTGPDGIMIPNKGVFHEIVEPERIVFMTKAFEDEEGNPRLQVLNTVTFVERDGKTELTMRALVIKETSEVAASLAGMEQGWNESLDRLAESLTNA
jgi:uncharacterized protein YndB with AHSA1/START domain